MKHQYQKIYLVLFLFVFALGSYARAFQAPEGRILTFQGALYENGNPVNGAVDITFSIVDPEWTETHLGVQVIQGLYSVVLGSDVEFPNELFTTGTPELKISVGGTEIASVDLHAPYLSSGLIAQNMPRRIVLDSAMFPNDTAMSISVRGDSFRRGLQVDMTGAGLKFATRSNVLSEIGDDGWKVGMITLSWGEGSGDHTGVYGQAFGAGKFNDGVTGVAFGVGNGATGFEDGSYNAGVSGRAGGNAWGNTGVFGRASGTAGEDNHGLVGLSIVGDSTNTTIQNVGVRGRAEGPGINKGVVGNASGGVENWAGWFNGDVNVEGQLMVNGQPLQSPGGDIQVFNPAGSLRADLNYFEPNDAGSVVLYGANDSTNVILGSSGGGYAGGLWMYDSLRNLGAQLRVTNQGRGNLFTYNEQHKNVGWFGGLNNRGGFMQLVDYDDAGVDSEGAILAGFWAGRPELYLELGNGFHQVDLSIQDSVGVFWMRGAHSQNFEVGSKVWEDTNGSDLPYLKMVGSDDATDLVWMEAQYDESDGTERGAINFRGTDGTEFSISSRGLEGGLGENINAAQDKFSVSHVNDPDNNDPTGYSAEMFLQGNSTPNFQMGGQPWENNDLGNFRMYGSTSDGGGWYHSNLDMHVSSDGTDEWGRLSLSKTNIAGSSSEEVLSLDASEGSINMQGNVYGRRFEIQSNWGNDGQGAMILRDPSDSWMVQSSVNDDGASNYNGTVTVFNSQNGFQAEMGGDGYISIHDSDAGEDVINMNNNGDIWAAGNFNNPRVEVQSNWGNDGQGAVIVKDPNDNWMIQASANDDGASNYNGTVTVSNSQNGFIAEMGGDGYISIHDTDVGQDVINLNNNGDIYASNSVSTDGDMNAVNFNVTSDRRFKKNVKSIDNALVKTKQLNGYTYNWNKLAQRQKGVTSDDEQIGVLAQELEKVFPQLVKTDEDGFKAVNYTALTAVLIEAIKDLSTEVESLKEENTELKAGLSKVASLEAKISLIEKLLIEKNKSDELKTASK